MVVASLQQVIGGGLPAGFLFRQAPAQAPVALGQTAKAGCVGAWARP